MTEQPYSRFSACLARWFCVCAALLALAAGAAAQSAPGSPVLLTEGTGTTTRGVAYEAVTFRSEPFPVVSPYNWNADKSNTRDQQTRVTLFAMNLSLLRATSTRSRSRPSPARSTSGSSPRPATPTCKSRPRSHRGGSTPSRCGSTTR